MSIKISLLVCSDARCYLMHNFRELKLETLFHIFQNRKMLSNECFGKKV